METIPAYLRKSTLRDGLEAKRQAKRRVQRIEAIRIAAVAVISILLVTGALTPTTVTYHADAYVIPDACELESVVCEGEEGYQAEPIEAHVTGYNTVPEQTDATPCIAASGDNICGRDGRSSMPYVFTTRHASRDRRQRIHMPRPYSTKVRRALRY